MPDSWVDASPPAWEKSGAKTHAPLLCRKRWAEPVTWLSPQSGSSNWKTRLLATDRFGALIGPGMTILCARHIPVLASIPLSVLSRMISGETPAGQLCKIMRRRKFPWPEAETSSLGRHRKYAWVFFITTDWWPQEPFPSENLLDRLRPGGPAPHVNTSSLPSSFASRWQID